MKNYVYRITCTLHWDENRTVHNLTSHLDEMFLDELKMLERYIELRDNKRIGNLKVRKSNEIIYQDYNVLDGK